MGRRYPGTVIALALIVFLGLIAAGFVAYLSIHKSGTLRGFWREFQQSRNRGKRSELPVEHGRVARIDELQGHGHLYFVPVGSQAIPVQSLADYYSEKFGINISVLPAVEVHPSDCVPARRQCAAEELMAEMTTTYSDIARDPGSVMIAVTEEDIFPQELDWKFTYSLHSDRIGIVSTHRMNPAFWGDKPSDLVMMASTKQMLTKYIAMLYFHLPETFDPTSVMYSPLTPNGGPDDIYESDLHAEASVNGRRGQPFACLYFSYSYETNTIRTDSPALADCKYRNPVLSPSKENFETNLGYGKLTERAMDLQLDSNPAIEFRRGYTSAYSPPIQMAFGWNTGHSFNSWLGTEGSAQDYLRINGEDGFAEYYFARLDHFSGFNPHSVYQSNSSAIYGAVLSWDSGHYKLQYRDGSVSTYLSCRNHDCYWTGYEDSTGRILRFERTPKRDLTSLTASDGPGIKFQYDDQHRIIEATASDGQHVSYEYDDLGCLAAVHRADGNVSLYQYDAAHRMISFSVLHPGSSAPEAILTNKYDQGRLVLQTLAGIGSYQIEYMTERNGYATELKIVDPAGQVLRISIEQQDYIVRTTPTRFQLASR